MTEKVSRSNIVISYDVYQNLKNLKEELDSLIETIEIMNDETLINGIKRSRNDLKTGRVHEIRNAEEFDDIWA